MNKSLRIKTLRKKAGFTQAYVAANLGIAKSTYCELENGKRKPSWELQQRLVQFFGIPAETLLEVDESA